MTFQDSIKSGYSFPGSTITLGSAKKDSQVFKDLKVSIPTRILNRHALVSGATGTGKTKTLQHLAESLSDSGVPVLVMDIKGDISGLSMPGQSLESIVERCNQIGISYNPKPFPCEFMTLDQNPGVKLRATISEFGPIVLGRMLELNDTQESILSLIFKFADDKNLPLLDIKDLKKLISFLQKEGKSLLVDDYGSISSSSTGIILRKLVELESQSANSFFGEPSFDIKDLLTPTPQGQGKINIVTLKNIQDRPSLFSAFMLSLISEVYNTFEEVGDLEKPKLVIMIDESHLLFKNATKNLMSQMETVIKLIRSKGVSIIFATQLPTDIPPVILSQLGTKIQFALRAFTAADRKSIKLASQNYPQSDFYQTEDLITHLGIGEALVTSLSDKGIPTPLVHTLMLPPASRMGPITDSEMANLTSSSYLVTKYSTTIDSQSAYEILTQKLSLSPQSDPDVKSSGGLSDLLPKGLGTSAIRAATTSIIANVTGHIIRGVMGSILKRR